MKKYLKDFLCDILDQWHSAFWATVALIRRPWRK